MRNYPSAWPTNNARARAAAAEEDRRLLCGIGTPLHRGSSFLQEEPGGEEAAVAAMEAAAMDAAAATERWILRGREERWRRRRSRCVGVGCRVVVGLVGFGSGFFMTDVLVLPSMHACVTGKRPRADGAKKGRRGSGR